MKIEKNDLISSYINKEKNFYCLIGPNTTGKSYILNLAFDELNNKTIFIDENGFKKTKGNKMQIEIFNDKYIYRDNSNRGSYEIKEEIENIFPESIEIINFAKKYIGYINAKNKSLGSSKLHNILNAFLSYNLNNIDYILIDEPENSLDDENLKIISLLIKKLINYKYVFIVTHSHRLLELLNVKIDDIYHLKKMFDPIINIKYEDVINTYKCNWDCIQGYAPSFTFSEVDKYDFNYNSPMMNLYLEQLLYSNEFYRTLFYSEVIIIEGFTEKLITKKISDSISYTNNYFVANGKNRIPFLINLFLLLNLKVICFIDTDCDKNSKDLTLPILLTRYIKTKKDDSIRIIGIEPDIESYFDVEKTKIIKELSGKMDLSNTFVEKFEKKYKPYMCYHVLSNEKDKRELAKQLFTMTEKYTF